MPPTTTTRQTPSGIKLDDGFPTKIACAADPDFSMWEKSVKPPGLDGGDQIDTTTMFNATYRTFAPRQLKTMTECSGSSAYDPVVYTQGLALINVETSWTVRFADGSTLSFFGFLKSLELNELEEGTQPELTYTIVPTNQDPTTGAEAAAVLASVAGT